MKALTHPAEREIEWATAEWLCAVWDLIQFRDPSADKISQRECRAARVAALATGIEVGAGIGELE